MEAEAEAEAEKYFWMEAEAEAEAKTILKMEAEAEAVQKFGTSTSLVETNDKQTNGLLHDQCYVIVLDVNWLSRTKRQMTGRHTQATRGKDNVWKMFLGNKDRMASKIDNR